MRYINSSLVQNIRAGHSYTVMYSRAISSERFATLSSYPHRLNLRCLFGHSVDNKEVAAEVSPQSMLRRWWLNNQPR